jgi:dipeptidyl aminopeptidase/acylaminoacyl peptidase
MKRTFCLLIVLLPFIGFCQQPGALTVEKIMRDPKWIGASPSSPAWSWDSKILYFNWNPEARISDSVYFITPANLQPQLASFALQQQSVKANQVVYNYQANAFVYQQENDIYYVDAKKIQRRITNTVDAETSPAFINIGKQVTYTRNQNIYSFDLATGLTTQLTNFIKTSQPKEDKKDATTAQEQWLRNDQLREFDVLRERKQKRDSTEAAKKALAKQKQPRAIYIDERFVMSPIVSPDGRFITYNLVKSATNAKNTIVPNYVTETGFTQDIPGRTKVGAPQATTEFWVYDIVRDTVYSIHTEQVPGITDKPDYAKSDTSTKSSTRQVTIYGPSYNESGTRAVVDIRSADNKDRWLMLLDPATGKLSLLDRQRDEAWIGGPAVVGSNSYRIPNSNSWIDDNTMWYLSEASGYSHLYTIDVNTGNKRQLTSGKFEVQDAKLSNAKKFFYLTTNEVHPGERHFYRLPVAGGKPQKITTQTGANDVTLSPDEKYIAILYSYSNKPWELYLQENKPGGKLQQVTNKAQSAEFASYKWIDPQVVTFTATDGAAVYGRLYKPTNPHPTKPAVIFVHGAGYLQNAHKWWSSYFREYMFHNMLVQQGYTVLDIDYRGSAGYGRDWRTGIYRHMGGKDLSDHIDAANYLVQQHGVDAKRIGIYGGSYGGFITLMAMFTQPDVFAAGAGLRSVTDWAHYNHGYTSNILNEPFYDSTAYRKSSPIYYAEGLKGALLMCHGMVDVNVHFQDIVRLSQRLIELGKENWELAVYPMEDHGFVEPSSWTDEYKRIYKLFETNLKK